MAKRGRPLNSKNTNNQSKIRHQATIYFDIENWQWILQQLSYHPDMTVNDYINLLVRNDRISSKVEIYELQNKIKEIDNQIKETYEVDENNIKKREDLLNQKQIYQNLLDKKLKEEEERQKESEKIVCIIRAKIDFEKKSNPDWLKRVLKFDDPFEKAIRTFKEMGITANFKIMFEDALRNYEYFQKLPAEKFISNYGVMFLKNEITNQKLFDKFASICEQKNQSTTIQNNTSMEPVENSNNTSVNSSISEIKESVSNENNINESSNKSIEIPNEIDQKNERGKVSFTSTGELGKKEQENEESKGKYIPVAEIKQEVKKRPKIGKFTVFEDREDICNDLKVHNIIEKREGCSEIKFYKPQTPHYISFKLPKKFNEYTEDQQKYLKDNFDVYAFSPSDPVEITAYVKKEEE